MAISIPPRDRPPRRVGGVRLWLLLIPAIVAVSAGVIVLSRSPVFHARDVEVVGASHLSRSEIVATAEVSRQTNVLWFGQGAVEERLEDQQWIASADVGVSLPWTITITVVERVPVAVASDGVGDVLVAGDGTVLGPARRAGGLPRIRLPVGPTFEGLYTSPAPAAAAIGAMGPELRDRLASVTVLADGTLQMRLRGGVAVRYGAASEIRRKAAALQQILAWAEEEGDILAVVNVVAPDLPAVKLAS